MHVCKFIYWGLKPIDNKGPGQARREGVPRSSIPSAARLGQLLNSMGAMDLVHPRFNTGPA
jgi:hypothetical protein